MKGVRLSANRLLAERPLPQDGEIRGKKGAGSGVRARGGAARSVTVNLAESPLGWLKARGHVTARQQAAGEQLRSDWERARLGPSITMQWDAPPTSKNARGAPEALALSPRQVSAKRRFEAALKALGPGLGDIAWRIVCAGEGMRDAEAALGWPARAGKLVLALALDRLAAHYRIR